MKLVEGIWAIFILLVLFSCSNPNTSQDELIPTPVVTAPSVPISGSPIVFMTPVATPIFTGLDFSEKAYDFGNVGVGESSGTHTFLLENSSSFTYGNCDSPSLSNTVDFSLSLETCLNESLAPGDNCSVTIVANPKTKGIKSTIITENCGGGEALAYTYALVGTGAPPKSFISQLGGTTLGARSLGVDKGEDIIIGKDGQIYFTGHTTGQMGGNLNAGGKDIFVGSMDPLTEKLNWLQQLDEDVLGTKGSGDDVAYALIYANDPSTGVPYIWVAGDTDGMPGGSNGGGTDPLLVRLKASDGSLESIHQITTNALGAEKIYGLGEDSSGNIYLGGHSTGDFTGTANINGSYDIILAKFNSSGTVTARSQIDSQIGNDYGMGLAIDSSDNVYVTGYSTGDFMATNGGNGLGDVIVVKLNSSLVIQNLNHIVETSGGVPVASGNDVGMGVVVDSSSNIYVCGYSSGNIGGGTNAGSNDIFVGKITQASMPARSFDDVVQLDLETWGTLAKGDDKALGCTIDSSGNIYVTGTTTGYLGKENVGGSTDIFVAKFDSNLDVVWVNQFGRYSLGDQALGNENGQSIAVDGMGHSFVTGSTSGEMGKESNGGGSDVIVGKMHASGTPVPIR